MIATDLVGDDNSDMPSDVELYSAVKDNGRNLPALGELSVGKIYIVRNDC